MSFNDQASFRDRADAGRRLAKAPAKYRGQDAVVLALPRGGAPVGAEIAEALGAPLDLVLVRKIGAPFHEELAIGAIADGERPELVTDSSLIADLVVPPAYVQRAKTAALP